MKRGYTVAVGQNWSSTTGRPLPDRTCGHAHRTERTAIECANRLYGAGYQDGEWTANLTWHGWYILRPDGYKAEIY